MIEEAWKDAFQNELMARGILHFWSLDMEESFQKHDRWLQYPLCSFAREECSRTNCIEDISLCPSEIWFCCQLCGRCWASSEVQIFFQIMQNDNIGNVKMHIFKQKCKICNTGSYEHPMFIPENIEIAISMLVNRICERIYNMPKEDMPSRSFIVDARQDGPHDSSNCEGCAHGICIRRDNRNEDLTKINIADFQESKPHRHHSAFDDLKTLCGCCIILWECCECCGSLMEM